MAQTVQVLRTTSNNPPATLLPGAFSVELGTQTKLWVGSAGGNRLLLSTDPVDVSLGGKNCVVAAAAPSGAVPGTLWWDSTGGQLYVRYNDGNSTQWIATSSMAGNFLPLSGGTISGALNVTGQTTIAAGLKVNPPSGDASLVIEKTVAGTQALLYGAVAGKLRWGVSLGDAAAESGSNAGSNFGIARFDDAGAFVNYPLSINRANGEVVVSQNTGIISIGVGQTTANWNQSGSRGALISLKDTTTTSNSGGAIEFSAASGAWTYAVIKGKASNGGGNSQGGISFQIRAVATDANLTEKGFLADNGVWYNTNGTWSAFSDRSLKENITPYTNGLAAILGLEPVSFTYLEDVPFADGNADPQIGLIAQDAAIYVPEIVGEHDLAPMADDPRTVATTAPGLLVYTLINAVKELEARLSAGGL